MNLDWLIPTVAFVVFWVTNDMVGQWCIQCNIGIVLTYICSGQQIFYLYGFILKGVNKLVPLQPAWGHKSFRYTTTKVNANFNLKFPNEIWNTILAWMLTATFTQRTFTIYWHFCHCQSFRYITHARSHIKFPHPFVILFDWIGTETRNMSSESKKGKQHSRGSYASAGS